MSTRIMMSLAVVLAACASKQDPATSGAVADVETVAEAPEASALSKGEKVRALLESLETGAPEPISYINPNQYIQHNLAVADGLAGFGQVMQNAPEGGFKAKVHRVIEDGDLVAAHTEYDFFGPKAGFDVFRFEDGLIVEHWDNLLDVMPPNPSGRTQFDGPTEITDLDKTEANKQVVANFVNDVLIAGQMDKLPTYFDGDNYIQHNPQVADGLSGFGAAMKAMAEQGLVMKYEQAHMLIGQGNFVVSVAEGTFGDKPYAYYDLFRIENGKIAEHWDVMAEIPPQDTWKNQNGKF